MSGGLREVMPVAAWLVDQLRKRWGAEATDALVRASMQGKAGQGAGAMYVAEVGPDGQLREFGRTRDGRRVVQGEGGLAWVDADGHPLVTLRGIDDVQVKPYCSAPLNGSSRHPCQAGNSSPLRGLLRDSSKGVT